jgi:hypothetical protein
MQTVTETAQCIFPMTTAVAPVCWFAGHNKAASFVGSGVGGMGGLNIVHRSFFTPLDSGTRKTLVVASGTSGVLRRSV